MEIYNLKEDVKIFGMQVKTFPAGVGEAFETLANKISESYDRAYYGISYFDKGSIIYKAVAEEKYDGEAEKYNYEKSVIPHGKYVAETITDWRKKLNCIKDVFHEMMQDERIDKTQPCIEWYKDDDEMLCMIKSKV